MDDDDEDPGNVDGDAVKPAVVPTTVVPTVAPALELAAVTCETTAKVLMPSDLLSPNPTPYVTNPMRPSMAKLLLPLRNLRWFLRWRLQWSLSPMRAKRRKRSLGHKASSGERSCP